MVISAKSQMQECIRLAGRDFCILQQDVSSNDWSSVPLHADAWMRASHAMTLSWREVIFPSPREMHWVCTWRLTGQGGLLHMIPEMMQPPQMCKLPALLSKSSVWALGSAGFLQKLFSSFPVHPHQWCLSIHLLLALFLRGPWGTRLVPSLNTDFVSRVSKKHSFLLHENLVQMGKDQSGQIKSSSVRAEASYYSHHTLDVSKKGKKSQMPFLSLNMRHGGALGSPAPQAL